jgi:hypothetical protein
VAQTFGLAALPSRDADGLEVDTMWIGRKPFRWARMETLPGQHYERSVFNTLHTDRELRLEVRVDELMEVERKTVRHDGWGN